jgi:hypothetical protein
MLFFGTDLLRFQYQEARIQIRDSLLGRQVVAKTPLACHNQPSQAD